VAHFGQLLVGARRRLGDLPADDSSAASAIRLIDICLERALKDAREPLEGALASAEESLRLEMPQAIAEVIVVVLERARTLPVESQARRRLSFLPAPPKEAPLPPWVPPGRSLGGFFVVRALSAGAVGTVFVARRVEQRRDPKAERFALKVPEYDAAAARTLSEDQFLQLFREEAGALLALPRHPNIARFVTFDAGAKPKPILVMELVEGPTLERLIELGELSMDHAMAVLQGVAAGLEAMHSVGVGHLDVKPSNVILRETHDGGFSEPVLVDFGLAGRHVRPGCGTAEYGAPELWSSESRSTRPMPVDVYAFGCMIYEVLTARTLFTGPHETALITQHLTYDGVHPDVVQLQDDPRTARLGQLLRSMLRRDPDRRADIRTVRRELQRLSSELEPYAWPLGEHGAAVQPTG
jgi:serine/threonine protein kinase